MRVIRCTNGVDVRNSLIKLITIIIIIIIQICLINNHLGRQSRTDNGDCCRSRKIIIFARVDDTQQRQVYYYYYTTIIYRTYETIFIYLNKIMCRYTRFLFRYKSTERRHVWYSNNNYYYYYVDLAFYRKPVSHFFEFWRLSAIGNWFIAYIYI